MSGTNEDKQKKLEYLRGYRDAVSDSWDAFLKMATKGYSSQELQIVAKTASSNARHKASEKVKEAEKELAPSDIIDADAAAPPLPPMPMHDEPVIAVMDLKPGLSYLIEESRPTRCFQEFKRAVEQDRPGMAIVRKAPGQIAEFEGLDIAKTIWLTKTQKSDAMDHMPVSAIGLGATDTDDEEDDFDYISPTQMPRLFAEVSDFLGGHPGGVIIFEGIEYMLSHNKFESVLSFIQSMTEMMITKQGNLIMSINPDTLEPRNLNLLKRDMN